MWVDSVFVYPLIEKRPFSIWRPFDSSSSPFCILSVPGTSKPTLTEITLSRMHNRIVHQLVWKKKKKVVMSSREAIKDVRICHRQKVVKITVWTKQIKNIKYFLHVVPTRTSHGWKRARSQELSLSLKWLLSPSVSLKSFCSVECFSRKWPIAQPGHREDRDKSSARAGWNARL